MEANSVTNPGSVVCNQYQTESVIYSSFQSHIYECRLELLL